jgi:hypothetical protein
MRASDVDLSGYARSDALDQFEGWISFAERLGLDGVVFGYLSAEDGSGYDIGRAQRTISAILGEIAAIFAVFSPILKASALNSVSAANRVAFL